MNVTINEALREWWDDFSTHVIWMERELLLIEKEGWTLRETGALNSAQQLCNDAMEYLVRLRAAIERMPEEPLAAEKRDTFPDGDDPCWERLRKAPDLAGGFGTQDAGPLVQSYSWLTWFPPSRKSGAARAATPPPAP